MSSDYYFRKCKVTLAKLETAVNLDVEYQMVKIHDKTLCEAVHRWTAVLGQYMSLYNEIIQIAQGNLQVQKAEILGNIINGIVLRILELRRQLEKIENSNFQFLGSISDKFLTTYDTDMTELSVQTIRPQHIQDYIDRAIAEAKEEMEAAPNYVQDEEALAQELAWWEDDDNGSEQVQKEKEEVPEAIRITRQHLNLIISHEKTRQVTRQHKSQKLRREMWEKELKGLLNPPASYEIRVKSAQLIQYVMRKYFELKREKIKECTRNEILGIRHCQKLYFHKQKDIQEEYTSPDQLQEKYHKDWKKHRIILKENYIRNKKEEIMENYRDYIREWFWEWFKSTKFIHSIPKNSSVTIFRGELSDPFVWIEEYKEHLKEKAASKNKSQSKFAKMAAKNEQLLLKREQLIKKKAEAALLRKIMKNPTMHPGYKFPQSKYTDNLLKMIKDYHATFDKYDDENILEAKEKYIVNLDIENVLQEIKLEILPEVDRDMKKEYMKLKRALKADYEANEENMPEEFERRKRNKKQKNIKEIKEKDISAKIKALYIKGVLKDYPKTQLEHFIGDPNFAGDALRCAIKSVFPFSYDIKAIWWERCRESCKGFHKILLVGPKGSGRTKLVHALASINNAILFELDLYKVQEELKTETDSQFELNEHLKQLMIDLVVCARVAQPSVIHIKHIQMLYLTKAPPKDKHLNLNLMRKIVVQKLCKNIKKTDNITVIGSCSDPWLTISVQLLKKFPVVLMLPNTSHSLIVMILQEWLNIYSVIPRDFNISSLAQVLQGYSFGYLKQVLENFMSAERIAQIAAYGLNQMDIYNFIIDEGEEKVDYDKYQQWYSTKTHWGLRESKHLQDQLEFQAAIEKYLKKKKMASALSSAATSHTTL